MIVEYCGYEHLPKRKTSYSGRLINVMSFRQMLGNQVEGVIEFQVRRNYLKADRLSLRAVNTTVSTSQARLLRFH